MARRKRVLIYVLVFMWLTAFSVLITPPAEGTGQPTPSKSNPRCVSRDPAKNRQCLKNATPKASLMRLASVNQVSQLFYYNRTAKGRLNSISENKTTKWKITTTASSTTFTTTSGSSAPTTTTLNGATLVEVYRTDHWIWYSDSAIYSQNQQYIQPLLNWPETSYTQISQWLGLILPPGSYDGGRRAIFIDPSPGYFGWTSGGSIGIAYQVFKDVPDWPWVVVPHETTNMFTGEGVSGGWPTDWWADGRSPFPAMVAVQLEKTYNVPYWSIHDSEDSGDVQYVMMRDKLLGAYGWSLFSDTFAMMKANGINLANINPEFQDANWISLHYLKSHTIAFYLSRAAGVDLSSTLNQGSVGTPPPNWGGAFYNYQINLASVVPTAQIQSPTGTQRGTITLTASASDPDWGIADITVWYSLDNSIFYYVGSVQNGATSITWDTIQAVPLSQSQVWVMAISHDYSGFESAWSVSNPFVVDNTLVSPAPTFNFSLSNSGDMAVTQGNSGLNTISVTMVNVQAQVVGLSCNAGLPSGAACAFNPTSGGSNFTSSLTVTTLSSTPPGSYPITVTGTSGTTSRQSQFTLTVNAPPPSFDFSISGSSTNQTVTQGQSASYSLMLNLISGAVQTVSLNLSGCPTNATCSINPQTGSPTFTSMLNVATASSTPPGRYSITLTALSGGPTHSTTLALTVTSPPPVFDFSLSNSGSITSTQGGSGSNTVTVTMTNAQSRSVSLNCSSGLPAGASCTFNPASGNSNFTSALTINTLSSTPAGSYMVTATGTDGAASKQTQFAFTVNSAPASFDFGISASPANQTAIVGQSITYTISLGLVSGNTQPVLLSLSGCPAGVSCSFAQQSGNPTFATTLTVASTPSTPTAAYLMTIVATSGGLTHSTAVALLIVEPSPSFDFSMSNSGNFVITQGSSGTSTITVSLLAGAGQPVTLSCGTGLPSGANCAFDQPSGNPGFASTLTISSSSSTVTGTYSVTVTGTGAGLSRSTTMSLTVNPTPVDFSVSSDGGITVTQGSSGSTTISVAMTNIQTVALTCTSGLPSGAECVFTPASGSLSFASNLTISTQSTTPSGPYMIVVSATSGSTSRNTQFTLAVNAPSSPFDFSISMTPSNQTIKQGETATFSLSINLVGGNTQPVSLSSSGCPSGSSCLLNPQSSSPTSASTLTVATVTSTTPSTYSLLITATSGTVTHSTTATLVVTAPTPPPFNFDLSNGGGITVTQGGSASNMISASLLGGSAQTVALSCTNGLPAGTACNFNSASGSPTFVSSLSVGTSPATPTGSYPITVTAVGGGLTKTTQFTLTVNSLPFDFSLSNNGTMRVVQGKSGYEKITTNLISGSTQPVTLSCAVPSAISCSLNPASGIPGFQSILTIGTLPSTRTLTELVTVTGIAGGTTRTTQFNLTVVQYRPPTVTLSPISGPAGTFVTVTGSNFAAADATCLISSPPGSLMSNSTCSTSAGFVVGSFAVAPNAVSGTTYTVLITGGTGDAANATFTVTVDPNTCTVSLTFDRPMVAPNRNASLTLTAQCLKGVGSYQIVVDIDNATQIANVGQAIGTGFMINPTLVASGMEYRWLNLNANGQFSGTLKIPITIATSQTPLVIVQFTLDSRTAFKDAQGNSLSISPAPPLAINLYKVTAQKIFQALDAYFQNKQCSESSATCELPLNRIPKVQDVFNLLDIYFN